VRKVKVRSVCVSWRFPCSNGRQFHEMKMMTASKEYFGPISVVWPPFTDFRTNKGCQYIRFRMDGMQVRKEMFFFIFVQLSLKPVHGPIACRVPRPPCTRVAHLFQAREFEREWRCVRPSKGSASAPQFVSPRPVRGRRNERAFGAKPTRFIASSARQPTAVPSPTVLHVFRYWPASPSCDCAPSDVRPVNPRTIAFQLAGRGASAPRIEAPHRFASSPIPRPHRCGNGWRKPSRSVPKGRFRRVVPTTATTSRTGRRAESR